MNLLLISQRETTRELWRRVKTPTGAFTSVPDGHEVLHYSVSLDLDTIDSLAKKAAVNKKPIARDGALVVHITKREKRAER